MCISLRARILLLITGTVTGLSLIVLIALSTLTAQVIQRTVRADARSSRSVLTQVIRERGHALTDQCLLLAHQPALKQYLFGRGDRVQPDFATVSEFAQETLAPLRADAALIADEQGKVLGATNGLSKRSAEELPPGYGRVLQGQSAVDLVVRHDRLMLAVSVPVVGAGYVQGAFIAFRSIDRKLAEQLGKDLGAGIAFVHKGDVIAASLSLPKQLPISRVALTDVRLFHQRYAALYSPFPDVPIAEGIGFVTLLNYEQTAAPLVRFQWSLEIALLLTLVAALVSGTLVTHGVTRPLEQVITAARTLSRGEWPEPFIVQGRDEIGLLKQVFNDMTGAVRESREKLLALIDIDPLTGIDNHRRFQERLSQETLRSSASGEALTLLLFDLDHFQEYNRRFGHGRGDEALQDIAHLLKQGLPEVAILGRYGGEEFAVLLPGYTLEQAEAQAERLREQISTTFRQREMSSPLTMSVGCATLCHHTQQAEGVALAAELAVSRAKQLGRDRVCRFDSVPGADENSDPFQLHRYIKDGSLASIQALAAAVDAKDSYTQGHSQRVAEYSSALAKHIGMSKEEVDLVYTTGTLHDVGKIGVPDAILRKPSRLDDDERAVMETHPALGEVIVRKIPQLVQTLPGVRHHHERWDGKGYPDRLSGEEIPRLARLLALADTYDAMTSDRPYRKGLPIETALAEITRGAGTQFDPALAPAFVEVTRYWASLPKAA